ncbi:MAG: TetR/AcrR family transcriptional regulator [Actinobacteria bacterium]|nr:TetR/AcrR family transcriptional regulator [Actinomycetota bacterium]MBI3256985.1 TetR/AcrR family transcriptional regulator [Actinomycetota bacterium]
MERRLTARGRERRRQLLDFAAERFATRGYHSTSVTDIIEGVGVGKGVFYWYFSSKEELFLEILREAMVELRQAQQEAIADEPDPVHRIEVGIRSSLVWLDTHRNLFALLEFAVGEERFGPALRHGQKIAVADVARQVEMGMEQGRIRHGNPELLTHAILGVTNQLTRVFIHERGGRGSDIADDAVAFCLGGLLGQDKILSSALPHTTVR